MLLEIVNPAEWMPRIRPMLEANWAETGFDFPFDPDIEAYGQMYEAGLVFAVRAGFEGETVGYCTVLVTGHGHNPAVKFAANDGLYVSPAFRNGITAGRLIVKAEQEAKARGAQWFSWHCRAGTSLDEVLKARGYQPSDIVVTKELSHGT